MSGTTVTLVAAGTCTIAANQAGDASYAAAAPVQRSFTVTAGAQTIMFAAPADRTFGQAPLTVAPTASSGLAVALSSATTAVCTVSGTTVTVVAAGTCTVRADQAGDANWAAAGQVSRSFTVAKGGQAITFTAPPPTDLSGGPVTLTAIASSGLAVTYAGTSGSVCTISGSTVTLVAAGTCALTANQAGDANHLAAAPATASFTVLQDPVPVTVPADGAPAGDGALENGSGSGAARGASITLSGSGYKPYTTITLVVYSTPVTIGTTTTDGAGAFSVVVQVPEALGAGSHTLVAAGLAPDNTLRYLTVPVAVTPDSLAVTGPATRGLGAIGAWAVVVGTVLALLGNRRTWFRPVRAAHRGRHAA